MEVSRHSTATVGSTKCDYHVKGFIGLKIQGSKED